MKKIPLPQGKVAIVDDEDYARVSAHKWCVKDTSKNNRPGCYQGSIKRNLKRNGKWTGQGMSKFILGLGCDSSVVVNHKNGNRFDCRKDNLRVCTRHQSSFNNGKTTTETSSLYKGVSWQKSDNIWTAQIKLNGKKIHLGCFDDEIKAAREYDKAALKYFGVEFAHPNFPTKQGA